MKENNKDIVCPKCNSNEVRDSGPFARRKEESEPAYNGPDRIFYNCLRCGHQWEK